MILVTSVRRLTVKTGKTSRRRPSSSDARRDTRNAALPYETTATRHTARLTRDTHQRERHSPCSDSWPHYRRAGCLVLSPSRDFLIPHRLRKRAISTSSTRVPGTLIGQGKVSQETFHEFSNEIRDAGMLQALSVLESRTRSSIFAFHNSVTHLPRQG